ncbi:PIR Superfamily Protein [Plasmodium ovale wallikeri]|uniref:PIR Superfamily Protein n=1 Tax=Plasmodium ovale wallikeri TaxID=864142 RepID=A0A1A9AAA1_PLAOA|nr:PIR Superfamily Protein [Plasmodium ovale wallikeri]SBT59297.1 PIR Superfamily Protein [Plasmodium ovale wallikeri]
MSSAGENELHNYGNIFGNHGADFDNATKETTDISSYDCGLISLQHFRNISFITPCKKIAKYLKYIKERYEERNVDGNCKYMNYRLNEKVQRIKDSFVNGDEFFRNLKVTYKKLFPNINICYDKIQYINKDLMEKLKNLHELYHNLNTFIINNDSSTNTYCNYVDTSAQKYMNYEEHCKIPSNKQFCNEIKSFRTYYYGYLASFSHCPEAKLDLPDFLTQNKEIRNPGYGSYSLEDGEVDDGVSTEFNQLRTNILISFSIIIIIPLIYFILHKFTPFGSSLRNYLQRKNRIRNIFNEFTNKFLRKSENNEINSENRTYNISYQYEQDF